MNYDLEPLGSFVNFHSPREAQHFFREIAERRCASVVKSHFAAPFFVDQSRYVLRDLCKVVYIVRNPVDVMRSYQRFIDYCQWREGPKGMSLVQFVNSAPEGRMVRYQAAAMRTILDRWASHALGWIKLAETEPDILIVRYEDLNGSHRGTTRDVLKFLGVDPPTEIARPHPRVNTVHVPPIGDFSDEGTKEVGRLVRDRLARRRAFQPLLAELHEPIASL